MKAVRLWTVLYRTTWIKRSCRRG